jgi:hypothetical protein
VAQIQHVRLDPGAVHDLSRNLRQPERLRHFAGARAVVARSADDEQHA